MQTGSFSLNDGLRVIADRVVEKMPIGVMIVAIAGGSCSGKSYLCTRLGKLLTNQGIVYTQLILDDYFMDIDDPSLPTGSHGEPLFDAPESYHAQEIGDHLIALVDGKPIDGPVYDLARNRRIIGLSTRKEPEGIVLVDGLFAINIVRDLSANTLCVFVDASSAVRLKRRIGRDTLRFGVDSETIRRVFRGRIEPAHEKFVEPQRSYADLTIGSGK